MVKKAEIGTKIMFQGGIIGEVEKINDNSVIVNITENPTTIDYAGNKTVVNHRNYVILSE